MGLHLVISLCFLYHYFDFYDLPVIQPTDFMLQNFKDKSKKDKSEIFMEVTRNIMSEIGGLEKSSKGIRENFEYYNLILDKKLRADKKID